jgi:hypothetical protein
MTATLIICLSALAAFWLFATVLVVALCRMAARADMDIAQRPRRASTCGTVRRRILKSPQSDQFATYK